MQVANITNNKKYQTSFLGPIVNDIIKNKYLYIMALPVVLYYLIFCYAPMYGVVIAFKQYEVVKGILGSNWVGLKYFEQFFKGIYFTRILKNTLVISIYQLIVAFPIPILFALLTNEIGNIHFKRTVQTITYLPHFISMVVVCGMIADFFSTDGIITSLLSTLGLPKINYLGSNDYFVHVYVWTGVWQTVGWNSIIYLAALTGIDPTLYEAARIDGAGRFKQIIHITLPGISSTIVVMLILKLGQIMSLGYEKIVLLYGPATYESADIISSFVYRYGISGMQYSFSTAVGLFQAVINLILLTSSNYLAKKFAQIGIY